MFKFLSSMFSNDISIDLGTANTLICMKEKGIVLNEPSVVAVKTENQQKIVVAVGQDAKKMLGKTPKNIETIRPMKDGVIADDKYIIEMLRRFLKKVQGNGFFKSAPRVLISDPSAATPAQRKTIYGAAEKIGASEIFMIDEPMAAAIGAKLPVEESVGSMVVDIGGGTTDIAIISINDMVYSDSINMAGDHFNVAIMDYVKKNHKIAIGEQTAERIKHEIGSAYPMEELKEVEVRGRSIDGIPTSFKLDSNQILEALSEPLRKVVDAVKKALEKCPAEVSADICERGIYLTGGGALLSGIDQLIRKETGLPVVIADDPLTCVALGGCERLKQLVGPKRDLYNQ